MALGPREYVFDNASSEVGRAARLQNSNPSPPGRPYRIYLFQSQRYVWRAEEEVTVISQTEYEDAQMEWMREHRAGTFGPPQVVTNPSATDCDPVYGSAGCNYAVWDTNFPWPHLRPCEREAIMSGVSEKGKDIFRCRDHSGEEFR